MKFAKKKITAIAFAATAAGVNFAAYAADAPKADLVNRRELRVCSDPSDLPFSNEKLEGFENQIAKVIADDLKVPVSYTWFPKATGFIRMTLFAKKCDLVIGWGQGDDMVLNTNSIYRSVSALIFKPGTGLDGVESLSDPKLQGKKIGIVQNDPGGTLAAKYGLMNNMKGYRQMVDRRFDNPAEQMMKDIRAGEIDAGIHWGPIASYWASRGGDKLTVVPLRKDLATGKIAFRITMGVRNGDDAWKKQLNEIILRRQGDIDKILLDYGVPVLVDEDTSTDLVTEPRKSAAAAPPASTPAAPAVAEKPAAPAAAAPAVPEKPAAPAAP
jgi:quinoprotein dehydrogenase-associated probable ABC transporter substrate-binding protein